MPDPIIRNPDHQVVEAPEYRHTDIILGSTDLYPGAHPPPFQSGEDAAKWMAAFRKAESIQRVAIAVSPGCSFKLPSGRFVKEGEEIWPHEFDSAPEKLSLLTHRRVVIRLTEDQLCRVSSSPNWRFRVAEGQALITRAGIVDALGEVREQDLEGGLTRILELISRGVLEANPKASGAQ